MKLCYMIESTLHEVMGGGDTIFKSGSRSSSCMFHASGDISFQLITSLIQQESHHGKSVDTIKGPLYHRWIIVRAAYGINAVTCAGVTPQSYQLTNWTVCHLLIEV